MSSVAPVVSVVGSLNADRVLRVEALPRAGETLTALRTRTLPGGKGANQAVALARLGCHVRMLGAVGTDPDGALLRGALRAEGIDIQGLQEVGGPSGGATVLVDQSGENLIVVTPGANARVDAGEVLGRMAGSGPVDVLLLQLEVPLDVVAQVAQEARGMAQRIVLNAAPAMPLDASLLGLVDVLVVNEHEARIMTGLADPTRAVTRLAAQVRELAVVTLGSRGGLYAGAATGRFAAASADAVVDSTGAGDCFVAALCDGLARCADSAADLPGVLERAARAAALAVTREGAQPAMPTRVEVDA
ncbi:ribokinase [Nocardioides sp. GY 10127]|uniref:ribokinase n=1 Tax=Nocardioides sp. GY 10127 TaxID=2569762 RepID=UPI0010A833B4|nr:ribokinase [Nocardioides sp. GY 10127]TIC81631.1 ribokinase [Nocardioides sp. GY 10127]